MEKTKKIRRFSLTLMLLGLLMILAAAALTGKNLYESKKADISASATLTELQARIPERKLARKSVEDYLVQSQQLKYDDELPPDITVPYQMEIPLYLLDPDIPMPRIESGGRLYIGTLNLPTLGLELPVLDDCTVSGLKLSPCRWSGSAYKDDLVICAHNYQRHFGMLKNLAPEDPVSFTDGDGNLFAYRVSVVEILEPESVDEMENSEYDLTLYTCTVGGLTRVTVRCMREEVR